MEAGTRAAEIGVRAILWSCCLAAFAIGANGTAIMAALPTMRGALGLGPSGVEWAVNAYLLVSAAAIVLGGEAADRFGARTVSIAGLVLFGAASGIIALSDNAAMLLAGRTLQGLAAALVVPSTLAAIGTITTPARRPAAIGAWTGLLLLGFSIGPLFGGAVTHAIGWRWIFGINVVLMLAAIAGFAAGSAAPHAARGLAPRTDWAGFGLLAVFMVSLVVGLHALPQAGTAAFAPLGVAVAAFAALALVERRRAAPLVAFGFFARRRFALGVAMGSLAMFCIMSLLLYFNLFAQSREGLGYTPLEAGAALLPLSASLLAFALSAPRIVARVGLRLALAGGMGSVAIASGTIAAGIAGGGVIVLLAGLLLMGAGLALPYASAPRLALSALAPEQTGKGSGMINACTFLAGSVGVAGSAIAEGPGGFYGVLAMVGMAGLIGAALGGGIAVRD